MRRLRVVASGVVLVCGGCWPSEDLVDGTFTPEQWATFQGLQLTQPDPCVLPDPHVAASGCAVAAQLGQELFFDPALSGSGTVACTTCHDPDGWFIDTRTENNVSLGTSTWTKRNSTTLVDVGLKFVLSTHHDVFTADGTAKTPGAVFDIALRGPMASDHVRAANLIRFDPHYRSLYAVVFGLPEGQSDDTIVMKLESAFDAYLWRLTSVGAPFDRWLAGDATAISDSAKRGFAVFVGRGTCFECHNGPLLTDFEFHATGVPQTGAFVPTTDLGRNKVTMLPADVGRFLTPSLRHIAKTGPYMHDGALATLGDVIAFYRAGGAASGYSGTKDPRIVPLDITDDDARDLEVFLATLTGADVAPAMRMDIRPAPACVAMDGRRGVVCSGTCVDLQADPGNCGACGTACPAGTACDAGFCVPNACPVPLSLCNGACVDLTSDPMNCGTCGHACTTYCTGGTCGGI